MNMDYIHTITRFVNKMVKLQTQSSQSAIYGTLKRYDSFGVEIEIYRLRGERPIRFFPWTNVDNIEETEWRDA